jgi:hypothetical protein
MNCEAETAFPYTGLYPKKSHANLGTPKSGKYVAFGFNSMNALAVAVRS